MDPSLASIIAALIGATASVVVALIGKARAGGDGHGRTTARTPPAPRTNVRVWTLVTAVLVLWMAGTVLAVHPEWGRVNFLLIPVITIALALIAPVRPWAGASVVLLLYSLNLFVEPVGWLVEGIEFSPGPAYLLIFPAAGIVNAVVVAGLARWRGRAHAGTAAAAASPALVDELERLRALHDSGALTDAEFERAKERLLG